MSERTRMTLAKFKTCKQRDFENGAVQDEIYESIKRMEKLETQIERYRQWFSDNAANLATHRIGGY